MHEAYVRRTIGDAVIARFVGANAHSADRVDGLPVGTMLDEAPGELGHQARDVAVRREVAAVLDGEMGHVSVRWE